MKTTIIILSSFILLLCGCGSTSQIPGSENMVIERAEFIHWSEPPVMNSDIRERGTDLQLTVSNWPEGAVPEYIIFREKKSFPAVLEDSTMSTVTIRARIIRNSSVLSETSETTTRSDRLVFMGPNGKTGYVEIEEWNLFDDGE